MFSLHVQPSDMFSGTCFSCDLSKMGAEHVPLPEGSRAALKAVGHVQPSDSGTCSIAV